MCRFACACLSSVVSVCWNTVYRTERILYNCVIVYRVSCILYLVSTILYTTTLPLTRNHVSSISYPPCHWKQDAGTRHDHRSHDNITEHDRQSRHHISWILDHVSSGSSYQATMYGPYANRIRELSSNQFLPLTPGVLLVSANWAEPQERASSFTLPLPTGRTQNQFIDGNAGDWR